MKTLTLTHRRPRRLNRGFTLVELMIALLIGLFIVGGLLTLMFSMRRNTASQAGMSQLQDNERMSMNIIAGAVQSAGYYPDPFINWTTGATGFFPVTTVAPIFATAGQPMMGVHTSTTTSDTLVVRYATNGTDNILNCAGQKSTTAKTWTSTFSVVGGVLQCVLKDGVNPDATLSLVAGVSNLQVEYGVQTTGGAGNSVDTYLFASAMNTTTWNNVLSVRVTLWFDNPLNQPGKTPLAPVKFMRVITLMNKTGVDT